MFPLILGAAIVAVVAVLTPGARAQSSRVSTPVDRAALFDYIVERTMAREAFSPVKNVALALSIEADLERYRDEFIHAATDDDLYYALVKLSNARKDRHLTVSLVPGGLVPWNTAGLEWSSQPSGDTTVWHAPLRFAVDYGNLDERFLFVADTAAGVGAISGTSIAIGDRVMRVNGRGFADYVDVVRPFHRYSSENGFWWHLATWFPQRSYQFGPDLYEENLTLGLARRDGSTYTIVLPYRRPQSLTWGGVGEQRYPGFLHQFSTQTYHLYLNDAERMIALDWYGFREDIVFDMDRLMDWARSEERLDHAVIFDGTRSRGGSLGAYALQRLSSKPFKTTFGNLRVSDVIPAFEERRVGRTQIDTVAANRSDLDDGRWLADWLATDVMDAIRDGRPYTENVPFKLAHAPKDSDGILAPAAHHFTGPLVAIFSPYGGSHLDQFASILVDNGIAHTIGMSAGGYSNTWEWEETLRFPISGKPVVQFMWSIGHSIRPNGEILEGNPALVAEYVPVTRDNYATYYDEVIQRAMRHIRTSRRPTPE